MSFLRESPFEMDDLIRLQASGEALKSLKQSLQRIQGKALKQSLGGGLFLLSLAFPVSHAVSESLGCQAKNQGKALNTASNVSLAIGTSFLIACIAEGAKASKKLKAEKKSCKKPKSKDLASGALRNAETGKNPLQTKNKKGVKGRAMIFVVQGLMPSIRASIMQSIEKKFSQQQTALGEATVRRGKALRPLTQNPQRLSLLLKPAPSILKAQAILLKRSLGISATRGRIAG